ncbi:SWEET sugar transporter [Corchorus olitorius]|uniref:Bidirectional sugar transporter SWEET n=1 Tax=Corchorus olitorius TaxID=93759 RepID=A0A1R3KXU3_9ROSI|nr:SWEET sugar transporter [Corchorus olitorius]
MSLIVCCKSLTGNRILLKVEEKLDTVAGNAYNLKGEEFIPQSFTSLGKCLTSLLGNIFAFGLFVSPIPTFRRIIRNRSTEQFSGLPYIYALLNCLICTWYGSPLISNDNLLVVTVNSIGAVFQISYIILFIIYANRDTKIRMLGLLLAVFGLLVIIVAGSLQIVDTEVRWIVVGVLSGASLISMFASPLFIINLVIRTKSVEYMPFYLSLSSFLMSTSFLLYGIFNFDAFIYVPNGIGTILGIVQLVLYFYYKRKSVEDSREPLIRPHA